MRGCLSGPGSWGWGLSCSQVPHGVSSFLPAVQAGFAEASHQNPGNPLPAEPSHRSRCLRHAWPPRPETSRCHHPLPSPDPRTSPFPNAASPRPHHARPHRLCTLLEPLTCRRSICRGPGCATGAARCGAALPGRLLLWLVGNHSRRHQPRLLLCFERAPAGARYPSRARPALPCIPAAPPARVGPVLSRAHHTTAWRRGRDGARVTRTLLCLVGRGCLSLACWFLVHHPPSYQTGRRGSGWSLGEGASFWPAGPCQPSGKGTARGVSAQFILGETTPAQAESRWFPSGTGLAVPLPAPHLPVLAGGFHAAHQPPTPHNPLCPTSQRAPAVVGTGHTDRIFTPKAIAEAQGRRLLPPKAHCPCPGP